MARVETVLVSSTKAFEATGPDGSTVVVRNLGPDSCFFATASTVSSGSNDGTLASGGLVSFTPSKFFISSGTSNLQVTSGADRPYTDLTAVTTGEESFSRVLCSSQVTMTSQSLRLGYFTARKTETITSLRASVGSTAAGATPSLVRYGLYTVAATGDITLVASTANDTTLLAATNTGYSKATSASYIKSQGQLYAFGALVVTAATAPALASVVLPVGEVLIAPRLGGTVAAQADLPATVAFASIATTSAGLYGVCLP